MMVGTCPFYLYEKSGVVFCEGATIKYPDKKSQHDVKVKYCCNEEHGYKNCSFYALLNNFYDRKMSGEKIVPLMEKPYSQRKTNRGRKSKLEGGC